MKKSYVTDYLRLNVIYAETVGLQARSFTTPALLPSLRFSRELGLVFLWSCGFF